MSSVDAYIYIIIGLLGVAYPILLQVIARLDEKYSSENIVELFDREKEGKLFRYFLISSLVFTFIWSLKLEPVWQIDGLNWFINNSGVIFVAVNTILLVVSFFFFVEKILIYYTPVKFIRYLRTKHNKDKSDLKYFIALSDVLLLSIKKQENRITKTISDFFYKEFRKEREKFKKKAVVFPYVYYEVVYKCIEELAILKEKRNYALEYRTAGGIWLLGELDGSEISVDTYTWIWRNLLLAIRYNQDDLVLYHWEVSHQYLNYSLKPIDGIFDYTSKEVKMKNQDEVDKRFEEREKFKEFNYALGGLLTYSRRYDCLKRIFNHTTSQPPTYELLPESMGEIFRFYFAIRDIYDRKYSWISSQHPFPNLSGLSSDDIIKRWLCSYMAILFLRQYALRSYIIWMEPLEFPQIPKTQGEIKEWIDGMDFFKSLLFEHLNNQELITSLNFNFLTKEWCIDNKIKYPLDFIDQLKMKLESAYQNNALTLPISKDKVAQFEFCTKNIIESTIERIEHINNGEIIEGDLDNWYVNGDRMIQSKDAFSEIPEADYGNFDSVLASYLATSLIDGVANIFHLKKTIRYLLKEEDIFKAIDFLDLNEQFIIVAFGFYFDSYINYIRINELTDTKYKNIEIYSFNGSRLVDSTLYILKKSDLPNISTKEISKEILEKYSLDKISDTINLYASVIDMNRTTSEVFEENRQGNQDEELRKSVLLSIIFSLEIKWKKSIELIELVEYSEYKQQGLLNELNEIKPIKKDIIIGAKNIIGKGSS